MRLLRVIHDTRLESGGPVEGLLRTSQHLLRDGHEVEVVSLEPEAVAASRGFPFPVIGLGAGTGRYGFNPRLTAWVKENAGHYDVAVLHGLWNYSSVGAWRGLRRRSTPFYIYVHGMMDPWFRQRYPLKHMTKQAYWWLLEGRVLRDAEAVLFTSEEERLRARGVFLGHTYNEKVVRYGSGGPPGKAEQEIAAFYGAYPALKEKSFLLFLGRIHPKKGCDILIQAFQKAAKGSMPELELAIAGPDQVGWSVELKTLSEKLGISHQIHWLGMLKGERKWGALRAAQAMILPSHQENFGIAVTESMACSTPVLISRAVNIWQEVEQTRGGFTASDTEQGTIELIDRFCALTNEERVRMGVAARAGFLRYFDVEAASSDFAQTIGFTNGLTGDSVRPRRRILQVIHDTNSQSGGPFEALANISGILRKEGYEVEVATLEEESEVAHDLPFQVRALGPGIGKYGYNPRLGSWLRRNVRRFDAVILHGLWNYSSFGAWSELRKSSIPYFVYAHGMIDPWFRSRYPFKHTIKQLYWLFAEGRVLRDAAGVLFTCEEEKIRARNAFRGYSYRERVVRFGTADPAGDPAAEMKAFRSAYPALSQRRFLLFLGRIHPKKACDLLIRAFASCIEQIPHEFDLVFAGPDQIGWTSELQDLQKKLGVETRTHWLGMLKGDLKWGALRSAEAMILPSHQENFGIVVAESMACSTPVLISNRVNIWREVASSKAGIIEPDTIEGTQNLIYRFIALSNQERNKMRCAARQGFLRHFSMEVNAPDLLHLLENTEESRLGRHANVQLS